MITPYRDSNVNLRTHLLRIIKHAGLEPWPKLFQNLRSTRETELADEHPPQAVRAWIGNLPRVTAQHYLQVTDDHFLKVVQNAVQQGTEYAEKAPQQGAEENAKTP